jgi:Na+/melibiose symporter-like transporter
MFGVFRLLKVPAAGTPEQAFTLTNHYLPRRCPGGIRMLVSILITFLVVILVLYLINLLPLDGRAKQIARVVVIILGVISLLRYISV